MKTTKTILTEMGACPEAVKWAGRKTHKRAWETCERGDWLLWISGNLDVDRKLLVLAACACARTALRFVPAGEDRPRIAIETAEAWTKGKATIEQVQSAANAAYAARAVAYAASAYAADAAARAVAYAAAYSAHAAAYSAHAAAYSTHAAYAARAVAYAASAYATHAAYAYAAHAAAYSTHAAAARKEMAAIVRKIIKFSVIKKAIAAWNGREK